MAWKGWGWLKKYSSSNSTAWIVWIPRSKDCTIVGQYNFNCFRLKFCNFVINQLNISKFLPLQRRKTLFLLIETKLQQFSIFVLIVSHCGECMTVENKQTNKQSYDRLFLGIQTTQAYMSIAQCSSHWICTFLEKWRSTLKSKLMHI